MFGSKTLSLYVAFAIPRLVQTLSAIIYAQINWARWHQTIHTKEINLQD
jgi:hypothetical protein